MEHQCHLFKQPSLDYVIPINTWCSFQLSWSEFSIICCLLVTSELVICPLLRAWPHGASVQIRKWCSPRESQPHTRKTVQSAANAFVKIRRCQKQIQPQRHIVWPKKPLDYNTQSCPCLGALKWNKTWTTKVFRQYLIHLYTIHQSQHRGIVHCIWYAFNKYLINQWAQSKKRGKKKWKRNLVE